MSIERARQDLVAVERDIVHLKGRLEIAEARRVKLISYIEISELYITAADAPKSPTQESGTPPRVVQEVISILTDAGHPIRTRDLLPLLTLRGLRIGSQNPVTNLSGSLSKWKQLLIANRREGWSLVQSMSKADPIPSSSTGPTPPSPPVGMRPLFEPKITMPWDDDEVSPTSATTTPVTRDAFDEWCGGVEEPPAPKGDELDDDIPF